MSTLQGGPNIIRDGLVFYLDAANYKSYPESGTIWTDLTKENNDGILTNGPTLARNTGFGVTINKTIGTTQRNVSIDYLAHRYDITRG